MMGIRGFGRSFAGSYDWLVFPPLDVPDRTYILHDLQQARLRSAIRPPSLLALSVPKRHIALVFYVSGPSAIAYPYELGRASTGSRRATRSGYTAGDATGYSMG